MYFEVVNFVQLCRAILKFEPLCRRSPIIVRTIVSRFRGEVPQEQLEGGIRIIVSQL